MQLEASILHRALLRYSIGSLVGIASIGIPAIAQVSVTSPQNGSTTISAVRVTASENEGSTFNHFEFWDNGSKLGDSFQTSVDGTFVFPNGPHTLSVLAVTANGQVLAQQDVNFTVAENCSGSSLCNWDQVAIESTTPQCPPSEAEKTSGWVVDDCIDDGIQGGGQPPTSVGIDQPTSSGTISDQNELDLNGKSLHVSEQQSGTGYSNAQFLTGQINSIVEANQPTQWTLDTYVYLPNPLANQALELDMDLVEGGYWTKFYTNCAFNQSAAGDGTGKGVWQVAGGGASWTNLLTNPSDPNSTIPCTQDEFINPWSLASGSVQTGTGHSDAPGFTGWHHIVWQFTRGSSGAAIYKSLTVDSQTWTFNFQPTSAGISAGNNGYVGPVIQIDGNKVTNGNYTDVEDYANEINISYQQ